MSAVVVNITIFVLAGVIDSLSLPDHYCGDEEAVKSVNQATAETIACSALRLGKESVQTKPISLRPATIMMKIKSNRLKMDLVYFTVEDESNPT